MTTQIFTPTEAYAANDIRAAQVALNHARDLLSNNESDFAIDTCDRIKKAIKALEGK